MQVATGTVVNGKIEVEGVALPEGALVAVVARGADEPFALSTADEEELLAAIEEIERGEFVTLEQLLETLPK
jgi:hypothetical protein